MSQSIEHQRQKGRIILRAQSLCSMLTSILEPREIAQLALDHGSASVGLTDPSLLGARAFSRACLALSLKPIHGLSVLVEGMPTQLTLLAKDEAGFRNLTALASRFDHQLLHPLVTREELNGTKAGLIALGSTGRSSYGHQSQRIKDWCDHQRALQDIFGEDFFLIAREKSQGSPDFQRVITVIQDVLGDSEDSLPSWADFHTLADELEIRLVAAPLVGCSKDMSFLVDESWQSGTLHESSLQEADAPHDITEGWPDEGDWVKAYTHAALETIQDIEERIAPFDVDAHFRRAARSVAVTEPIASLRPSVEEGWRSRSTRIAKHRHAAYKTRMEEELTMLETHLEWGRFLLFQTRAAQELRASGHLMGPGIGNLAASLAAWCLGLHDTDPVLHDLPFAQWFHPGFKLSTIPTACYLHLGLKKGIQQLQAVTTAFPHLHTVLMLRPSKPYDPMDQQTPPRHRWDQHFPALVRDAGNTCGPFTQSVLIQAPPGHFLPTMPTIDGPCGALPLLQCTEWEAMETNLPMIELFHDPAMDILQALLDRAESRGLDVSGLWRMDQPEVFHKIVQVRCPELRGLHTSHGRAVLKAIRPTCFKDLVCAMAFTEQSSTLTLEAFLESKRTNRRRQKSYPDWVAPILADSRGILCFREQLLKIGQYVGLPSEDAWSLSRALRTRDPRHLSTWSERFQSAAATKGLPGIEFLWEEMLSFGGTVTNRTHAVGRALLLWQIAWLRLQLKGRTP